MSRSGSADDSDGSGIVAVTASLAGRCFLRINSLLDPSWGAPGPVMDVKDGKLIITPGTNTSQTILNQANVLPNDMEGSFTMTFVKVSCPHLGSGLVFWGQRLQRILCRLG